MSTPAARLAQVTLGRRVVVRHLIEGGERATDVLGELVGRDADSVTVQTRRGPVRVLLDTVLLAKEVTPSASASAWRVAGFLRRASVAVLDLDGVLRTHDTSGAVARIERRLGMEKHGFLELAFALPEAASMLIGRARYADWAGALESRLRADGHDPALVHEAVTAWTSDHGTPLRPTVDLVEELRGHGIPVFVFTNGTDRVPEELATIGLGHLVPNLLNACELGSAKPAPEAYAAAHATIEERLGRVVGRGEVHFTDDRPANVDAARVFGWQARVFTPPAA